MTKTLIYIFYLDFKTVLLNETVSDPSFKPWFKKKKPVYFNWNFPI